MHVLAIHMKVMAPRSLSDVWATISGQWRDFDPNSQVIVRHNKVPIMMQDPVALMIHFLLLLPLNVDQSFFMTIVRACYNLQLVQNLVRITFSLTYQERSMLRAEYNNHAMSWPEGKRPASTRSPSLAILLGQVIDCLEATGLFNDEEENVIEMEDSNSAIPPLDIKSLDQELARLLVPFLRTASLIRHYVFKLPLPDFREDSEEFDRLVRFLDLEDDPPIVPSQDHSQPQSEDIHMQDEEAEVAASGSHPLSASNFVTVISTLEWFKDDGSEMKTWLTEFATLACKDQLALARQYMRVNILWKQPSLLRLNSNFDNIFQVRNTIAFIDKCLLMLFFFQYYHKRKCGKCNSIPKEPTVCLLCGTMVCMREQCCKTYVQSRAVYEATKHAQDCGGGTGIFLSVPSSNIVVIRGRRACIWGSVFLDVFGEEDRELK